MTGAPKTRPYAVAMLFGSAGNVNLGLGIVGAMDREHAGAVAVLTHVRENKIAEPLVGMTIMEIDDSVVRQMFNNLKPGEVVNLRAVPADEMADARKQVCEAARTVFPPPCGEDDHEWVKAETGHRCLKCGSFTLPYQYAEKAPEEEPAV